ncbi:hypothetical protein HH214_16690 [Mucilaginibacter robiniae]|uniref:Uncharacterized protein n=1 Tax=Mucilaginibacter robiniae TaxID=2728022 RepID=A0A7L5E510_9SPHI|nr:hypothetical protein [Mucilaginibacter robiniae]QJD97389.1 hypothetical protein HH214_16690 [Mucilaginibacter robiniae]
MKTLLYVLLPILFLSTKVSAQSPTTFNHIPGNMRECDNRYYLSAAGKSRGQMIWIDNFDKGVLTINGHQEKLKSLKFPDRRKYGFFNKNYTVSIRITSQTNTTGRTYTAKGVFTVLRGSRVIFSRNIIAAGGC